MNFQSKLGSCLRKKRLKEPWADGIIRKAKKEGTTLYKYWCNNCASFHLTKQREFGNRVENALYINKEKK